MTDPSVRLPGSLDERDTPPGKDSGDDASVVRGTVAVSVDGETKCVRCQHKAGLHRFNGVRDDGSAIIGSCLYCDCETFVAPVDFGWGVGDEHGISFGPPGTKPPVREPEAWLCPYCATPLTATRSFSTGVCPTHGIQHAGAEAPTPYPGAEGDSQKVVARPAGYTETDSAASQVRESCREEKADGSRCGAPAETLLWGKLLPPEALGPRCYEHAAKHIGERAVHDPTWAAFDLRRLFRYGAGTATPESVVVWDLKRRLAAEEARRQELEADVAEERRCADAAFKEAERYVALHQENEHLIARCRAETKDWERRAIEAHGLILSGCARLLAAAGVSARYPGAEATPETGPGGLAGEPRGDVAALLGPARLRERRSARVGGDAGGLRGGARLRPA